MVTKWISTRAIADELGVHLRTVQRWVQDGKLPAFKIGGRWRVRASDYEAFLSGGANVERVEVPPNQVRFEVVGDEQ